METRGFLARSSQPKMVLQSDAKRRWTRRNIPLCLDDAVQAAELKFSIYGCTEPLELEVEGFGDMIVPCRRCRSCRARRRSVLLGRCLSEMQHSDSAFAFTGTYGRDDHYRLVDPNDTDAANRDHRHAGLLHYPDVQLLVRRLRHHVVPVDAKKLVRVRYMASGEYGREHGRAHWHLVVMLRNGTIPNLRLLERYDHEAVTLEQAIERGARYKRPVLLWQNGFSYWEEVESAGPILYALKYYLKSLSDGSIQSLVRASAGLGRELIELDAVRYVNAGLSPQMKTYQIPGHMRPTARYGKDCILLGSESEVFQMSRNMGEHFLRAFTTKWIALNGSDSWPVSECVDRFRIREAERVYTRALQVGGASLDDWRQPDGYSAALKRGRLECSNPREQEGGKSWACFRCAECRSNQLRVGAFGTVRDRLAAGTVAMSRADPVSGRSLRVGWEMFGKTPPKPKRSYVDETGAHPERYGPVYWVDGHTW